MRLTSGYRRAIVLLSCATYAFATYDLILAADNFRHGGVFDGARTITFGLYAAGLATWNLHDYYRSNEKERALVGREGTRVSLSSLDKLNQEFDSGRPEQNRDPDQDPRPDQRLWD